MMGPAGRLRDRYDEVSRSSGLFADPDSPLLRSLALEHLWRENMLAQLCVDQGITQRAMFVGIGPQLNRRVMAAFRVFQSELIPEDDRAENRVPCVPLTLESIIDAIAAAGGENLARNLWARYCDFERIYHLCLSELIPPSTPIDASSTDQKGPAPRQQLVRNLNNKSRTSSRVPEMTSLNLLTVEDRVRLLVNALSDEQDHVPVLKLFTPDANATWLISECDPDDPDRLFDLCDLGLGFPELG